MDSRNRTIAKATTWQVSGLIVMTILSWAITGSLTTGGALAISGSVIGMLSYFVHERLWARIQWGRAGPNGN